MKDLNKYIESGILELYVLGMADDEEVRLIEQLAKLHPEIKNEIDEITKAIRLYAAKDDDKPNETVKPFVFAIIDFQTRMQNGEVQQEVPLLNENSKPSDYQEWLSRPDMTLPARLEDIYAKLIGVTQQATTAIVWLKTGSPPEVHDNEYEKFLILEGTCDIVVDGTPFHLSAGDYMSIPLHSSHFVKVTSLIPCKVILQRVAA